MKKLKSFGQEGIEKRKQKKVDIYRGGLLEDIKYCVRKEKVKNRRKLTFGLISGIILQCKGH